MMTVNELIQLIMAEDNELLDSAGDYIPYVNWSMDLLSFVLAGIGDPEIIQTIDIVPTAEVPQVAVPEDFVDFIPHNGYPVNILNGYFQVLLDSGECRKVKYSTVKPHVSTIADTVPFKQQYVGTLVLIASYMVKKKMYIPPEYCEQDKAFARQVLDSITKAKGAA